MTPPFGLFKKSYPLRVHISTLFLILALCSCGALSLLFYNQSREMIETEMDKRLGRILRETTTDFERLMIPPKVAVNLLSRHQLAEATTLEQRLATIPFLIEAMNAGPDISSLYAGYEDGDFFLMRRIENDGDRAYYDAPAATSWLAQSIEVEGEGALKQFFYLNEQGERLAARFWETDYDPRSRVWFEHSIGKAEMVRSEPYLFYTDRKIGMTFSRGSKAGRYVIGADIRLETLSDQTRNHKVTPNTQVVLFEADQGLIAYEEPGKLVKPISTGGDTWDQGVVADLEVPALDHLLRDWSASRTQNLAK